MTEEELIFQTATSLSFGGKLDSRINIEQAKKVLKIGFESYASHVLQEYKRELLNCEVNKVKEDLKKLYPNRIGFIEHTVAAKMCKGWLLTKLKEDE